MNIAPRFLCLCLCVCAQLMAISAAGATIITREFTAAWFDSSRPGHGVGIEVIDGAAGKTLLAYWFTYDTDGRQLWLYGTGPVVGDTAQVTVFETQGGSYDGSFDPSQVTQAPWGTLTLSFSDCNNGRLDFDPAAAGAASGSMPLIRSTRLFNSSCSGGVSDDRMAGTSDTQIVSFLPNVGPFVGASAKVKFEERADRTEFSVELEDLPLGNYSLMVGGIQRATITVNSVAGGTRGEVEFRSPVEPGKQLLTFDPRGALIQVNDGATALFAGQLGSANPGPTPTPGPVPLGNALYELIVEPSGNDGPELHAKLEQRSDRVDFSVELEDVAAGSYQILVGGVSRGTLAVVSTTGGTEGELEFRDPVEAGKLLLDFDPRGQVIAATRNGSVVLQGTFPNTPTGTPGSGGGGGNTTPPSPGLLTIALTSTGADSDANGEASFEVTSNETEFEVEIEDLDDGDYQLLVGGILRATISVVEEEGRVKFNSPAREGRLLLDFDPRGQRIDISRNGTVFLTGTL